MQKPLGEVLVVLGPRPQLLVVVSTVAEPVAGLGLAAVPVVGPVAEPVVGLVAVAALVLEADAETGQTVAAAERHSDPP